MLSRISSALALGVLSALPLAAKADFINQTINFEGVQALKPDNSNAATATTLDNYYVGRLVTFDYYRYIDPVFGPDPYIPVTAATYSDYGLMAPVGAGANALNGKPSDTFVRFSSQFPTGADSFGFTLGSAPGLLDAATASVYGVNGSLLATLSFAGGTAGSVYSTNVSGIGYVQLSAGVFYDNVKFTGNAVPEQGSLALIAGLGAFGGVALLRRRK